MLLRCLLSCQVAWPTTVANIELKPSIQHEAQHMDAVGQLILRAVKCFQQQPQRNEYYGCVGDSVWAEFYLFQRLDGIAGSVAVHMRSQRTSKQPLYCGRQAGLALQLLVGMLYAAPESLGFKPNAHPPRWAERWNMAAITCGVRVVI